MFKIGILTDDIKKDFHSAQLFEEASGRAETYYLHPQELQLEINKKMALIKPGNLPSKLDALIIRRLDQSLDTDLQFDLLSQLQRLGVVLVNSYQALSITESKALTSYLLAIYGLPVIESLATQQIMQASRFMSQFNDVIIKPLYGHLGEDVFKASELENAQELISQLINKYGSVFVQRYVEANGRDIRAFVISDHVSAAIERKAEGGWKTNIFQGAKPKKISLSKELRDIAVKASQIAGLDYCGVDLISENGKTFVLELNGSPAWSGVSGATGKNIAAEIISAVIKKLQSYRRTGQIIAS